MTTAELGPNIDPIPDPDEPDEPTAVARELVALYRSTRKPVALDVAAHYRIMQRLIDRYAKEIS